MHEIVQSYLETLKTTQDKNVQEELTLKLAYVLEFSNRKFGYDDYPFYQNYLPEPLLAQKMDIPIQHEVVQELIYLIREVDHFQTSGLVWAISKAAPVVAIDAALTLIPVWPLGGEEIYTYQLIIVIDNIYRDENGQPFAEIVNLLQARNPTPFLKQVLELYSQSTTKRAVPQTNICELAQGLITYIQAYLSNAAQNSQLS